MGVLSFALGYLLLLAIPIGIIFGTIILTSRHWVKAADLDNTYIHFGGHQYKVTRIK